MDEDEDSIEILQDVLEVPGDQLPEYILSRAEIIASSTQGDSWDDPEEWTVEAAELAHAVVRWFDEHPLPGTQP